MDYLSMLDAPSLIDIGANYNYQNQFVLQGLFTESKTDNIQIKYRQLLEGSDLPVMAQVHSLDAEARIGDRPNFELASVEKFFIKEKLNQTERLNEFLAHNSNDSLIKDFIFNDSANLIHRVLTRAEVMRGELLSTGKVTVDENNAKATVDFNLKADNKINFTGWSNPTHDILGDIEKVIKAGKKKGRTIERAITSSTIIGYMSKNEGIMKYWVNSTTRFTEKAMLEWIKDNYSIEFIEYDDVYKLSALATDTKRFFDENSICFLTTTGTVGSGLWGITPEQRILTQDIMETMFVTVHQWKTDDPVAVWTKASGLYVPVIPDINGKMYISKITA